MSTNNIAHGLLTILENISVWSLFMLKLHSLTGDIFQNLKVRDVVVMPHIFLGHALTLMLISRDKKIGYIPCHCLSK